MFIRPLLLLSSCIPTALTDSEPPPEPTTTTHVEHEVTPLGEEEASSEAYVFDQGQSPSSTHKKTSRPQVVQLPTKPQHHK